VCPEAAPGLVQTYHKYKDRGVAFLSVTGSSKESAESYVTELGIPWPCMYEMPAETLEALGAFLPVSLDRKLAPTVYLVDADGTVLWNDKRARYYHKDEPTFRRALEQAIETELRRKE
jgi:hypothetical protein